jgi:altronate dehydratase
MVTAPEPLPFPEIGRIPAPGDNVAIATRTLPAGTRFLIRQLVFELTHTVLEGHRFGIFRIRKGEPLLSWGLPFGLATRDIEPGEYICNEKILRALADRHVDFKLPSAPNFLDYRLPFELDAAKFRPGQQVSAPAPHPTFRGFRREDSRGAGTRNYVVVLGTNSRAAALARAVAQRFADVRAQFSNIDGVVPVDHTEGGAAEKPNNLELTLRTLAGFMVNPNVGAVLCLDFGPEPLSNESLRRYLVDHRYPVGELLHDFLSVDAFESGLDRAVKTLTSWLQRVNEVRREEIPITHLRLGLQCGGSDAFSGVSGNPLIGILSRETVAHGGSANLAETTELIGAESYVLANVRDLTTAQAFLDKSRCYQEWAARHGHTAEGNPSGGNNYRGLYNIAIKSIGAALKKDPSTRLDYVIDYGEPMTDPGFYFMDSPGNDLESIAGQVAAGCNMILFSTGNGSITNFPFVPTIKIMTTTRRFELVRNEMDFNAGRYQDGEALEDLGREAFGLMLDIASGQPSAGEKAGHSQVQLWREWRSNPPSSPSRSSRREEAQTSGPLAPRTSITATPAPEHLTLAKKIVHSARLPRIALVLPTSLCAGQISLMIAEKLNRLPHRDFDRAVALPHTEGCGNSGGESERLFLRTMAGYLAHPFVAKGLLLEHGCEKTHNDAFRNVLRELNLPESRFGFRSIQLDGGIESVTAKSIEWFQGANGETATAPFSLGLHGRDLPENVAAAFALVQSALVQSGARVLLSEPAKQTLPSPAEVESIPYGARFPASQRIFVMECPTDDDLEIVTGLATTGAQMIVAFEPSHPLPANPLVPTLQLSTLAPDADLKISESTPPPLAAQTLLNLILEVRSGQRIPAANRSGNTAFQITRGYEGISL